MKIPAVKPYFLVVALLFTTIRPALADTYQIFTLWSDQGVDFYSMDDSGNVALVNPIGTLATEPLPAYYTFHDGVATAINTATVPTFVDDQGTPCTPAVPSGGSVVRGVCNNGRDAFTGFLQPNSIQTYPGLYTGSDPSITTVKPPEFGDGMIFMDSNGDIVVDDTFTEEWYYFEDTSVGTSATPEPGSFALFGTGALGLLIAIRRRLCA
jgi:PEP-CTERM motif